MHQVWFVISKIEEENIRKWLTIHPFYKFHQSKINKDLYINSIPTLHNAEKGDVKCKIMEGDDDQINNILVTFTFRDGTLDEGFLGLISQNFDVVCSSWGQN